LPIGRWPIFALEKREFDDKLVSALSNMTLNDLVKAGPANLQKPPDLKPSGKAAVYYTIGTDPPLQVVTPFFQLTAEPKSLVLWFLNQSLDPLPFVMYVALEGIYLGPGEYEGNVNDIHAGLGLATDTGTLVWTAGPNTSSNLTTWSVSGGALVGTYSVNGLVPGPLFGQPDDPPPADQPPLNVIFSFFASRVEP
jgi:hypothetical protein